MRLENKVAVITGAASGFGAGTAQLFAAEGAAVVVADISDETGESIVDSINTSGGKAVYVHADVTSRQDTRNMMGAAENWAVGSTFSSITLVIHTRTKSFQRLLIKSSIASMMLMSKQSLLRYRKLYRCFVEMGVAVLLIRLLPQRCGHAQD